MKRIISILMAAVVFVACLVGCVEPTDIRYETVDVIVTDTYYHPEEMVPVYNDGASTTWMLQPAVYRIKVKYKDTEYTINGRVTYERYKNREGETVKGILGIREFEDGSVEFEIINLE